MKRSNICQNPSNPVKRVANILQNIRLDNERFLDFDSMLHTNQQPNDQLHTFHAPSPVITIPDDAINEVLTPAPFTPIFTVGPQEQMAIVSNQNMGDGQQAAIASEEVDGRLAELDTPGLPILRRIAQDMPVKLPKLLRIDPRFRPAAVGSSTTGVSTLPVPSTSQERTTTRGSSLCGKDLNKLKMIYEPTIHIEDISEGSESEAEEEESAQKVVQDTRKRLRKLKLKNNTLKEQLTYDAISVEEEMVRLKTEIDRLGKKSQEIKIKLLSIDADAKQIDDVLNKLTI